MNLLEFREFFRKQSGRFDLVADDFSDKGADVFVNAGQKYLDRMADIPNMIGRRLVDIEAGEWLVTFTRSRSILEVWSIGANSNGDVTRLPLTRSTQKELRGVDPKTLEAAYVSLPSAIDAGRPSFYTPAQLRLVTSDTGGTGGLWGFADLMADGYQTYNGIVLMPPADGDYTIEVVGNFYSDDLNSDTASSYWSEQHPMVLYMATMRQLEVVHRNTEGVKDWDNAIMSEVTTLDMDGVAEASVEHTVMRG